jgi:hypothetical protein
MLTQRPTTIKEYPPGSVRRIATLVVVMVAICATDAFHPVRDVNDSSAAQSQQPALAAKTTVILEEAKAKEAVMASEDKESSPEAEAMSGPIEQRKAYPEAEEMSGLLIADGVLEVDVEEEIWATAHLEHEAGATAASSRAKHEEETIVDEALIPEVIEVEADASVNSTVIESLPYSTFLSLTAFTFVVVVFIVMRSVMRPRMA